MRISEALVLYIYILDYNRIFILLKKINIITNLNITPQQLFGDVRVGRKMKRLCSGLGYSLFMHRDFIYLFI